MELLCLGREYLTQGRGRAEIATGPFPLSSSVPATAPLPALQAQGSEIHHTRV